MQELYRSGGSAEGEPILVLDLSEVHKRLLSVFVRKAQSALAAKCHEVGANERDATMGRDEKGYPVSEAPAVVFSHIYDKHNMVIQSFPTAGHVPAYVMCVEALLAYTRELRLTLNDAPKLYLLAQLNSTSVYCTKTAELMAHIASCYVSSIPPPATPTPSSSAPALAMSPSFLTMSSPAGFEEPMKAEFTAVVAGFEDLSRACCHILVERMLGKMQPETLSLLFTKAWISRDNSVVPLIIAELEAEFATIFPQLVYEKVGQFLSVVVAQLGVQYLKKFLCSGLTLKQCPQLLMRLVQEEGQLTEFFTTFSHMLPESLILGHKKRLELVQMILTLEVKALLPHIPEMLRLFSVSPSGELDLTAPVVVAALLNMRADLKQAEKKGLVEELRVAAAAAEEAPPSCFVS